MLSCYCCCFLNIESLMYVYTDVMLYLCCLGECQQQYFRVQPKDMKVQEGGETLLQCEVSQLAGQVQWTKDGFALGENFSIQSIDFTIS